MNYAVNCSMNETFLVEADDKDEAVDIATMRMEDTYGLAPGQVKIESIEVIK